MFLSIVMFVLAAMFVTPAEAATVTAGYARAGASVDIAAQPTEEGTFSIGGTFDLAAGMDFDEVNVGMLLSFGGAPLNDFGTSQMSIMRIGLEATVKAGFLEAGLYFSVRGLEWPSGSYGSREFGGVAIATLSDGRTTDLVWVSRAGLQFSGSIPGLALSSGLGVRL